jgi:hypothetical protein
MPLPSSGTISFANVRTETGDTGDTSMSWIKDNTKAGQTSNSLSGYYGKAWYQKTNAGNCNNGNCTSNCNCGNIQCTNCYIAGNVNCVNCDARAWLQNNCNCACTYNCSVGPVSYNCDCACACDCFGLCFVAGAMVMMADGTQREISTIRAGEFIYGIDGPTEVQELHVVQVGPRKVMAFAGEGVFWTAEHPFWTRQDGAQSFWTADPKTLQAEVDSGLISPIHNLREGDPGEFATINGWERKGIIDVTAAFSPATKVYMPLTDGSPAIVNGTVALSSKHPVKFADHNFDWDAVVKNLKEEANAV